jgi:hypothetical protein
MWRANDSASSSPRGGAAGARENSEGTVAPLAPFDDLGEFAALLNFDALLSGGGGAPSWQLALPPSAAAGDGAPDGQPTAPRCLDERHPKDCRMCVRMPAPRRAAPHARAALTPRLRVRLRSAGVHVPQLRCGATGGRGCWGVEPAWRGRRRAEGAARRAAVQQRVEQHGDSRAYGASARLAWLPLARS